jgi:hypothetical protein
VEDGYYCVKRDGGETGACKDGNWKTWGELLPAPVSKGDRVRSIAEDKYAGDYFSGLGTLRKINKSGQAVIKRDDGETGGSSHNYWLADPKTLVKVVEA